MARAGAAQDISSADLLIGPQSRTFMRGWNQLGSPGAAAGDRQTSTVDAAARNILHEDHAEFEEKPLGMVTVGVTVQRRRACKRSALMGLHRRDMIADIENRHEHEFFRLIAFFLRSSVRWQRNTGQLCPDPV
jgi:hypothetical protein